MDKVVGLDLSLAATGVVQLKGQFRERETLTNKDNGCKRLVSIRQQVLARCEDATLVALENYAFARPNQAHQVGELGGVIRVALFEAGIRYIEVTPGQVKLFATGKGNSNKVQVAVSVAKRWGVEFADDNQYDAYVLAKIAQAVLAAERGEPQDLTAFQKRVINELTTKKTAPKKQVRRGA